MKKKKSLLFNACILGIFIRLWLTTPNFQKIIADRIEVSTPLNSWKRIAEGLHLAKLNIHPYTGDTLHELPLHLLIYDLLTSVCGKHLYAVFIACDIITTYFLYLAASDYMFHLRNIQNCNKYRYAKNIGKSLISDKDCSSIPIYVVVAYLFNPYTIFNCAAFTTTVFTNLFMSIFFLGLMRANLLISTLSLAICVSQSLYPLMLIFPMLLQLIKLNYSKLTAVSAVIMTISFWGMILYGSFYVNGNWNFLNDTYGFILTVPDLRPNIGLFWYFFAEMFQHFRNLFIFAFQINVFLLYITPLSIRFRNDPMLLAISMLFLTATFKSYPCLGDVGFVISLLPCWKHVFKYTQQGYLIGCCFIVTTALFPIIWHLWIYSGSANANFYFGVTLAFATAEIFLITDMLFANLKREYCLMYGRECTIKRSPATLVLE